MLERIIVFIVLGIFVFTPAVSSWWKADFFSWYDIYLPWLLLILAASWLHWRPDHNNKVD
jgi:hypothetical protein